MWRKVGDELVCDGPEPCRVQVGERAVLYYPGERLSLSRAAELGIEMDEEGLAEGGLEEGEER